MKKFLIFMIAFLAMSVQTVSAQTNNIVLQHKGQCRIFNALSAAISASLTGDTIYLGSGNYGDATIDKNISIIGNCSSSSLGDVNLTSSTIFLYGLQMNMCTIKSSKENLHLDKCKMNSFRIPSASYTIRNMLVERCLINGGITLDYGSYSNCIFRNCKEVSTYNGISYPGLTTNTSNVTFENCNLYQYHSPSKPGGYGSTNIYGNISGYYINCVFGRLSSSNVSAYFTNCQIPSSYISRTTNCFIDSNQYTDQQLLDKGYLGTDGTIIGCNGGRFPLNLDPEVPLVEEFTLQTDYKARKLIITGTVKAF